MFSCHLRVLKQGKFNKYASLFPTISQKVLSNDAVRFFSVGSICKNKLISEIEVKESGPEIVQNELVNNSSTTSPSIFSEDVSIALSPDIVASTDVIEPAFSSIGLGHGWPSGWMQTAMELFHIDLGLPWWQAIGLTTVCLRCIVFPIMIKARKNMVILNEHQPTIQKLQIQAQLASVRGNHDEAVFANKAMNAYMVTNNCHPLKTMFPLMTQGLFFTSMFFGLRGMTNVPVESMKSGGILWFTDLTLADPTCVLPVLTASTLFLQLYLGADGINLNTMPPFMKKLMYAMPLISVPVMLQFPAALNVYWMTNNIISLVQATAMRKKSVQDYFGIPEMTKWKPEDLPATSFHEELKREIALQRKKTDKENARIKREKQEALDEENARRTKLLASFEEESRKELDKRKK